MKLFNKVLIFFVIVILSVMLSYYSFLSLSPEQARPLYLLAVLQLPQAHKIHFNRSGFAVSDRYTQFFSPQGIEIDPPISAEDFIELPLGFTIDKSSENYILINGKYIFRTDTVPFENVMYVNHYTMWDFEEFDDFLLLIKSTPEKYLVPYVFNLNTKTSVRLEAINELHYLNAAYNNLSRTFSILTLADDLPRPSSKVFHYSSEGALYGAFSPRMPLFFSIYRLQSEVVLIGTNRITCYNINGKISWDVDIPNAYRNIAVNGNGFLLIYLSQQTSGSLNSLLIMEDSQKHWLNLPWGLSSLHPFEDGFIGVERHRDIVVFDKRGNVSARFRPDADIYKLYWNRYFPRHIYILDRFNRLHVYTMDNPMN